MNQSNSTIKLIPVKLSQMFQIVQFCIYIVASNMKHNFTVLNLQCTYFKIYTIKISNYNQLNKKGI